MSTTYRAITEAQAVCDLRLVNSELHRVSLPVWLELGLPMAQLKALIAIASSEGSCVTELARSLSIGEPAASQLVEQLVRRGYVNRGSDPADRRRSILTATPMGADLVSELRQGRREHAELWLSAMSDEDVEALARGLRALARAAAGAEDRACSAVAE